MKRISAFVSVPVISFALIACSGSNSPGGANDNGNDSSSIEVNQDVVSAENVFVYVPSPIETAGLLKEAGAKYNKDFLNLPQNASKYSTTASLALNLGVYGADLAFAGIFDQHAETMVYLDCTGKLADGLHVSTAFSTDRKNRLEANMNNRDSVLSIITDSYWDCDALLHENKEEYASSLMVAGGWVEGLYLACKVAEQTNSNDIRVRIVEQRYSLDKLLVLLGREKNEDVKSVTGQLRELKVLFDALPKNPDQPTVVSTDDKSGMTTLGTDPAPPPVSLNALEFKNILERVTVIRDSIITRN
ncbi:MAG TPA: hypothetical protein VFU15_17765 [Bacteroidia bacterium]|nr:hypothetical protein [Bacteroidia bacterium]